MTILYKIISFFQPIKWRVTIKIKLINNQTLLLFDLWHIINADLVRWVPSQPEPGPTKRPVSSHCSACPTWFFSTIPNHYSKHISGKNCLKSKCCCHFLVVVQLDVCTLWMHLNIKTMKQSNPKIFSPKWLFLIEVSSVSLLSSINDSCLSFVTSRFLGGLFDITHMMIEDNYLGYSNAVQTHEA